MLSLGGCRLHVCGERRKRLTASFCFLQPIVELNLADIAKSTSGYCVVASLEEGNELLVEFGSQFALGSSARQKPDCFLRPTDYCLFLLAHRVIYYFLRTKARADP